MTTMCPPILQWLSKEAKMCKDLHCASGGTAEVGGGGYIFLW